VATFPVYSITAAQHTIADIEPTSWREYRGKFEFPDAGAQRKRSRAHRTPERKYITKRSESNRNDADYIYVYMDSCRGGKIVLPD
jgi:hypothetical protein